MVLIAQQQTKRENCPTAHTPSRKVCLRFHASWSVRRWTEKISFVFSEIMLSSCIPPHAEGRTRRHDTLRRGAVDASMPSRAVCARTNGGGADGEVVWSWPPGAEVKFAMLSTSVVNDRGKKAGPWGDHV